MPELRGLSFGAVLAALAALGCVPRLPLKRLPVEHFFLGSIRFGSTGCLAALWVSRLSGHGPSAIS